MFGTNSHRLVPATSSGTATCTPSTSGIHESRRSYRSRSMPSSIGPGTRSRRPRMRQRTIAAAVTDTAMAIGMSACRVNSASNCTGNRSSSTNHRSCSSIVFFPQQYASPPAPSAQANAAPTVTAVNVIQPLTGAGVPNAQPNFPGAFAAVRRSRERLPDGL